MPEQSRQTKIQTSQLSLPKGGGAIQGVGETFQANEFSGTAGLSVPIFASPCRDFAPQMQLSYNSGNGNGPWGMGFSLSLPQISRQTRKGTPRYQDTDVFVLSGSADLVALDQPSRTEDLQGISYTIQTFAPRQEGLFALIECWQTIDPSQTFWKVIGKDHTISIFGKTEQAKIVDPNNPSHIFTWFLEESYNTTGDHQLFVYKQEDTVNVPNVIYEHNHIPSANRYIERVQYGNDSPIVDSILFNPPADPITWHFEVIFDYGEYDIDPNNINSYKPINKWACRPDPFSRYEAGFEVRTYRRCLRILMFHCFPEELGTNPVLVHATSCGYETNTASLSQCTSITDTGYSYDTQKKIYTTASLPPLSLEYIPFQPKGHSFVLLTDEKNQDLNGLDESPHYTLIDLFGEGLPGILYSEKAANYYRTAQLSSADTPVKTGLKPLYNTASKPSMHYGNWEVLDTFPTQREVNEQGVLLQDLTGNGQLDVVLANPGVQGYWEAQPDHTWKQFCNLPAWPVDFSAPGTRWVDVTGDGIPDLIQFTEQKILVYVNARTEGLASPLIGPKVLGMPVSLEPSSQEVVTFADMAGSGQSHLVRIRNGEVLYWPNLGYGHFGNAISMQNAPDFGEDFNPTRLFLTDVDGSGTMDLVYMQPKQAIIYLNQSGNIFNTPVIIDLPVQFDSLDQVTFADIYGRGNACLVISEPHALPHPRYWCYDFCQGKKPYLLEASENNMGVRAEIIYGSSVDFYLADKQAGLSWITPLPFPVQVITQTTQIDLIAGSRYTSRYAYHHGYYDGVEREFRGFGRIDRQDSEYFPVSQLNLQENPNYTAPSLSRTWYHTGAYLENIALSRQFAKEYYAGDKYAFNFPDSNIESGSNNLNPDGETIRQAYVALAGTVLRTELYSLDDTPESVHPYSVSESNFLVRLEQTKGNNRYAIFYVHAQQSLTYAYERNHLDPQIHQTCTLAVDVYGNVAQTCAIAYPRRNIAGALPEQQQLRVTCATQSYINQTQPEDYLLGVPIESQSYEITTLTYEPGSMFDFITLKKEMKAALATVSLNMPSSDQAKLLGWARSYYAKVDGQDRNTILPLGQVSLPLLVAEQHVAEFSQEQVAAALQGALEGQELNKKLEQGYYQFDPTSKYWWNCGLTAQYFGTDKFYFSSATVDPIGNKTTYTYDQYKLFPIQVTDALDNTIKVQAIDYQHLHPMQLIDMNGNSSEIKLNPLGQVVYTSHYGHEAETPVGFMPISKAPTVVPANIQAVIDNPATYLGEMQSYFYYDPFAWQKRRQPIASLSLVAEQYPGASVNDRIQIHLNYSDGLGRTLCSKSKVEPGESFLYDKNTQQVTTGLTEDRWLTSGGVVYDNKGNAIKQYEPYFIDTPFYINNPILDRFGISATLYYDALDRLTHTITAKGYLSTHSWTPWQEEISDANDNFIDSPYCAVNILALDKTSAYYDKALTDQDRQALIVAIQNPSQLTPPVPFTDLGKTLLDVIKYFSKTPSRSIVDNLGNVIIEERINKSADTLEGEKLCNYYTYNISGRQLTSADTRLHDANQYNFITTYSLGGAALKVISADAGTRWALTNTLDNPLWSYDERQVTMTPLYDKLHRPTQVHVYKPATDKDPLVLDQIVEYFVYGDTPDAFKNPEANNLRGQIYQYYDQAGLATVPSYTLLGAPLASERQFRIDYKKEADWKNQAPLQLLQSIKYKERNSYDSLGRVTEHIDADGNETTPTYHLSGALNQITLTTADDKQTKQVVEEITYDAKGQRISIKYGNATQSTYSYDTKTWALTNLKTVNQKDKILQDLRYVYDPVGNIVTKTDLGQNIIYYKNQEVNPTATYRYDSLYRLIQGTGREKIGNGYAKGGKSTEFLNPPHANDAAAIQNYIEKYTYDRSNNLIQTKHIAQQDSWTRNMVVANTSNRAVISTINGDDKPSPTPEQVNQYFDTHGNQIQTCQLYPLAWNYRDNLQQAITVKHADGSYDGEYYLYDGSGQRVRKVQEQYGQNGTIITFKETVYLGGIEYRRRLQGIDLATAKVEEEYHSLRIMDDEKCVATRDYWLVGDPPTDFSNPSWRYHLDDYLGSCTVEVDEQGQQISYEEYSPYGSSVLFIGTGSADRLKHYRYSGKERDSVTGFYYYGARYYSPWLARWLSPDPAGTVDGLNLYAFVTDNPASYWDVGGMMHNNDNEQQQQGENGEGFFQVLGNYLGGAVNAVGNFVCGLFRNGHPEGQVNAAQDQVPAAGVELNPGGHNQGIPRDEEIHPLQGQNQHLDMNLPPQENQGLDMNPPPEGNQVLDMNPPPEENQGLDMNPLLEENQRLNAEIQRLNDQIAQQRNDANRSAMVEAVYSIVGSWATGASSGYSAYYATTNEDTRTTIVGGVSAVFGILSAGSDVARYFSDRRPNGTRDCFHVMSALTSMGMAAGSSMLSVAGTRSGAENQHTLVGVGEGLIFISSTARLILLCRRNRNNNGNN